MTSQAKAPPSPESARARDAGHTYSCRTLAATAGLAALLCAFAFAFPHPSSAATPDGRIGGPSTYPASLLPGGYSSPGAVAVSTKENGDIYLTDGDRNQRVDQFKPDGTFLRAFGWGIVPGAASGTGNLSKSSPLISGATTTAGRFVIGQIITGTGIPAETEITDVNPAEIKLSNPATVSASGAELSVAPGPGNLPTNEVQKLAVRAAAGQYTLTFQSSQPGSTTATTAPIAANATAVQLQLALQALGNVGPGNVTVSGGPGDAGATNPYLIEFTGKYADANLRRLTANDLGLSGGNPDSEAGLTTTVEGAGVLETCTTVCVGESIEEGGESGVGSEPGQLRFSDEIAVDNDESSPSYGDVYVVDQRNFRIEKYSPAGKFILMSGSGVDQGPHHPGDICTTEDIAEGDVCGAGLHGTGPSQFYQESPQADCAPSRTSWCNTGNNSIAVGPDGTVYVGDFGRIQEFNPDGTFAGEFNLPLAAGEQPQFVSALALDSSGNLFERSATYRANGEVFVQDDTEEFPGRREEVPGVREFSPAHVLLRTFDAEAGSEPTHIALDTAGDLFLSDFASGAVEFRAFKPNGTLFADFHSDQVQPFPEADHASVFDPAGIAVGDAAGDLYATTPFPKGAHLAVHPLPVAGSPAISEEHVTDIEPTTATLHAVINPEQFDTEYHFEYITAKKFEEDGNQFGSGTEVTPTIQLGSLSRDEPVQAPISSLATETAYRWRVVAESTRNGGETVDGDAQSFTTLPAVSVRDFTTQTVGPELVTLKAELDNNNSLQPGHYTIHYGKQAGNYSEGSSAGTLKAGSSAFEAKEATFTGLQPNTTYHYQLVAENAYTSPGHLVETPDQTFTTEYSSAEERAAESCSNTILREENSSLALPDCRAYEQVTPTFKAGFVAGRVSWLAPSGERVLYASGGAFAGVAVNEVASEYFAQRTAAGWATSPVVRRLAPLGTEPMGGGTGSFDASPELDRWIFAELLGGPSIEQARNQSSSGYYSLGLADGTFVDHATPTIELAEGEPRQFEVYMGVLGQSDDLSHLFIATESRDLPPALDPRPAGTALSNSDRIYAISGVGGPNPTISLAAEVVPLAIPSSGASGCWIDASGGAATNYGGGLIRPARLASADGSVLFYTAPFAEVAGADCGEGTPNPIVLFARIGQAPAIQLSAPPPSQCTSPHPCAGHAPTSVYFSGASPDGKLAWFTTNQPLVDSDTDATRDLYLARLETGSGQLSGLTQVSAGDGTAPPGQGGNVKGVVRLSQDGTHAAFVATGVLTEHPNPITGQSAAQGADNLYAYDATSGETKFVARLCSGPEESGSLPDPACPSSLTPGDTPGNDSPLWSLDVKNPEAEFTPTGRYLLFSSHGRLVAGDTDSVADVYRYDFQTGDLARLSFGRNGNDANGNDDAYQANIRTNTTAGYVHADETTEDQTRSISADGATVIFETAAPLVSHDTNAGASPGCGDSQTGCDVYQWQEAGHGTCHEAGDCISLISDGLDPHGILGGVISASGRDINFYTARNEVPGDTDGLGDIYDARVEGGFPPPQQPSICTSGDACLGPVPPPPPQPPIGTENEIPPPPKPLHCGKGRHRVKKHGQVRCVAKKHHKTKHHKKHKRANINRGGGK